MSADRAFVDLFGRDPESPRRRRRDASTSLASTPTTTTASSCRRRFRSARESSSRDPRDRQVRLWSANLDRTGPLLSYQPRRRSATRTPGSTSPRASPPLSARLASTWADSTCAWNRQFRSAAASRRARRCSSRCCARCARRSRSISTTPRIAQLAQRAENSIVGAPVGIMDQMVCSLGRAGLRAVSRHAVLHTEHVPIPAPSISIVIDSGVHHRHAAGEYRTRRRECEEAAARLGVSSLRDVHLRSRCWRAAHRGRSRMPLARRARHVVSENLRVTAMVERADAGRLVAELRATPARRATPRCVTTSRCRRRKSTRWSRSTAVARTSSARG